MSIKSLSKTTITAAAIASVCLYTAQISAAGIDNIQAIKKDIKIISKVMESSTELEGSRSKIKVSGNYLAKQGIVLKIRFPRTSRFDLNFDGFGSIAPIPVIPNIPNIPDSAGMFEEGELEEIIEEALESAHETMEEMPFSSEIDYSNFPFSSGRSEASKELRKQQKELRKQQRSLERKVREIERSSRDNNASKEKDFLKKRQAELKTIQKKIKSQAKLMKEKIITEKNKRRQQRTSMVNSWTNSLVDNFCNYAPYPRNLPKGEYLTLILTDAVYKENKLEDKIIVINNRQLTSCRDGKSDGKSLLSKSLSYTF